MKLQNEMQNFKVQVSYTPVGQTHVGTQSKISTYKVKPEVTGIFLQLITILLTF